MLFLSLAVREQLWPHMHPAHRAITRIQSTHIHRSTPTHPHTHTIHTHTHTHIFIHTRTDCTVCDTNNGQYQFSACTPTQDTVCRLGTDFGSTCKTWTTHAHAHTQTHAHVHTHIYTHSHRLHGLRHEQRRVPVFGVHAHTKHCVQGLHRLWQHMHAVHEHRVQRVHGRYIPELDKPVPR